MKVFFPIIILLLLCSGCGIIYRNKLMENKFPYYPEHIQQAIKGNYLIEGMDQEQVYLSLGNTLCTSSLYYQGSKSLIWSYSPDFFTGRPSGGTYDCLKAPQRVYFKNGIVVGWENMPF